MSNLFRIQYGASDGDNTPQAPGFDMTSKDDSQKHHFASADGEVKVSGVERHVLQSGSDDPLDNGRNAHGAPVPRNQLKPDTVVPWEGGTVQVSTLLRMGELEADPSGGYRRVTRDAPVETNEPEALPMERLSDETEANIGRVIEGAGEPLARAAFQTVLEGKDVSKLVPQIASRMGVEPHEIAAMFSTVEGDLTRQAQRALANVGVPSESWDAFREWVWSTKPNAIMDAIDHQFSYGRLDKLTELGRQFAATGKQFMPDEIMNAEFGNGIHAYKANNGRVLLDVPGHGTMPYEQAIGLGLIDVRKQ